MKSTIVFFIICLILSSLIYAEQIDEFDHFKIRDKNKVIELVNEENNKVIPIFYHPKNESYYISQVAFYFPHICIIKKDRYSNRFIAYTFFITEDLKVLKKRIFTFPDELINSESEDSKLEDFQLNCKSVLSKSKLSFCLWDSVKCNYIQPFNYHYYKDTNFEDDWSGYPDSFRDKKIEITKNRIIYGFQQSAVELIYKNGSWILSKIFAPEVPYCEFSDKITFTNNLLIACLGACCAKNENLVLIYELEENGWSNPSILGLKKIDKNIHYYAKFISNENNTITINYRAREQNEPELIRKYKNVDCKWLIQKDIH